MEFVIHKNKSFWGTVWHIITDDGMGHIEAQIETDNPNAMFVCGLTVYPAARRRGLATMLLHKVESIGINNEVNEIRLSVEKPKTWIRDLYIRRGYELVDENDEYYYLVKYV